MPYVSPSEEPKPEELAEIYQGRDCSILTADLFCRVSDCS